MKGFPYIIEAVVFFFCAAHYSIFTLEYEYVYKVVSSKNNVSSGQYLNYCDRNSTSSGMGNLKRTAEEASKWVIWSQTPGYALTAISGLIISSKSDAIGRKRALLFPLLGCILSTSLQTFIILFELPLYVFIVNNSLRGTLGSYSALMDITSAYLSDTVPVADRGRRFTILDVCASIGGGTALLVTGWWLKSSGFLPPSLLLIGCSTTATGLLFILPDEKRTKFTDKAEEPLMKETKKGEYSKLVDTKVEEDEKRDESSHSSFLTQLKEVWRIYTSEFSKCDECSEEQSLKPCCHGGGLRNGRVWRLWFHVISYAIYLFCLNGVEVFRTMFLVSPPICFTPDMVGAQNSLDCFVALLTSFLVLFYERVLGLNRQTIVLTGISGRLTTFMMMYFATGSTLVFMATSVGVISGVTTPYLRYGISHLVSSSEQGSAFSMLSFMTGTVSIFAPMIALTIYPATLEISYSFMWLVKASILLIPFLLMMIVFVADMKRKFENSSRVAEKKITRSTG